MPKKIITETTLPIALDILDSWEGKLTWDIYGKALAKELGVRSISRHTLLDYPQITDSYRSKKEELKNQSVSTKKTSDPTIEMLLKENDILRSKVNRLELENSRLKEQFAIWQYNLYMMPGVDIAALRATIDRPLVEKQKR